MSKHTPGKLIARDKTHIYSECLLLVAVAQHSQKAEADARRLAACWNAFDGTPTDAIEALPGLAAATVSHHQLRTERDALLEALQRIAGFGMSQFMTHAGFAAECQRVARAAIAAATGQGEQHE